MRRNGHNPYPFALERLHLLEFVDETAVIDIFHVGCELEDGHFLDDRDVKQAIVGDGVGHCHHATTIKSTVTDGEVQNAVVKDQFIIHRELDMRDFVSQNAFD